MITQGTTATARAGVALMSLAVLAAGIGCAGTRGDAGPLGLEESRQPRATASAAELLPWTRGGGPGRFEHETKDGAAAAWYEVLEGAEAGGVIVETRRDGPTPGSWVVERRLEGADRPLEERLQLLRESDGALVLDHSLNFERGVRVEFDRPPVTVPGGLAPGETIVSETRIRLPRLDRPASLRDRGSARGEMTYLADQRVRTGAGVFETRHLREVFTTTLTTATAVRTIDRWYAPGAGLVLERWEEEVRVFGVTIERSSRAMRLLPGPPEREAPPAALAPEQAGEHGPAPEPAAAPGETE